MGRQQCEETAVWGDNSAGRQQCRETAVQGERTASILLPAGHKKGPWEIDKCVVKSITVQFVKDKVLLVSWVQFQARSSLK